MCSQSVQIKDGTGRTVKRRGLRDHKHFVKWAAQVGHTDKHAGKSEAEQKFVLARMQSVAECDQTGRYCRDTTSWPDEPLP